VLILETDFRALAGRVRIIWPGISISPHGAGKFLILEFHSASEVTPRDNLF